MRTIPLAILAGILVNCLPTSASAQSNEPRLCPPGEIMQGGQCAPRPRAGPGPSGGRGTTVINGDVGGEPTVCGGGGAYHFCFSGGGGKPRK